MYQQGSEAPWSGYKELDRGVLLSLAFDSAPQVSSDCNVVWYSMIQYLLRILRHIVIKDDSDKMFTVNLYICKRTYCRMHSLPTNTHLPPPQVQQKLVLEGVWRYLSCLSRSTAFAVREQAGHSLKSAFKHQLSVDKRDDVVFPTDGVAFTIKVPPVIITTRLSTFAVYCTPSPVEAWVST